MTLVDGAWELFGHAYQLLPTAPLSFAWDDGTVQTLLRCDTGLNLN